MTAVPAAQLTPRGYVAPADSAVLAGVQTDINSAFGGGVNPDQRTPQGQLAVSEAAIISNSTDQFIALANGVDPAYASGRMQDAIARIYFLERNPDQSTVTVCTCTGLPGVIIPDLAPAKATDGNLYYCIGGGIIPLGGSISLQFACAVTGPIPCPANSLNLIARAVPGWDTINNPADGVLGNFVESRQAFEERRQQTVAANSVGFNASVLGAVLKVPGVLDAYVISNDNAYPLGVGPAAVVDAAISGTTMTVSSVLSGSIAAGQTVTGSDGTGIGIAAGTTIVSGSGTTWTVSISQTVAGTTLNLGGVVLAKNSLYVAAVGGDETAIAQAILTKKAPGCGYNGNTTVTAYDSSPQYTPPGIPYVVTYEIPPALPFVVGVTLASSPSVPSNATALVQAAVIAAFAGADGGQRARIGSTVFASRFYAGISALGSWAEIISILLGTPNAPAAVVTGSMGAAFTASGSGTNLTVSAVASGYISAGDLVAGAGVPNGTTIVSQTSGSTGGTGVYVTSVATTASSASLTSTSSIVDISAVASGTVAIGQVLVGARLADGTTITSQLTGSAGAAGTYRTSSTPLSIASETIDLVAPTLTRVSASIEQAPTVSAPNIIVSLI